MDVRAIGKNIIWGIINVLISIGITMVILPFISSIMGIEAYGYVSLSTDIVKYVDLIASTINAYAIRFISIEVHRNNMERAEYYYSSVAVSDFLLSMILFIPAIIFILYIDRLLNVPQSLLSDVRCLFFVVFLSHCITIVGTVFATASFVNNIQYKSTRVTAISTAVKASILVILYKYFTPHIWYVSLATLIATIIVVVGNIIISRKTLDALRVRIQSVDFRAVLEIASKGIWSTINSLGTNFNSGLDLLVSNIYLGATEMGILSVAKLLGTLSTRVLNAVNISFRPQLLKSYSLAKYDELEDGFLFSMKCTGLFAAVFFSVFVGLGSQFLSLWIPDQEFRLIFFLGIMTLLADTVTGFTRPLAYGTILTGKVRFTSICGLIVGLGNVLSMLLLLNISNGGLFVVVTTTLIGNVLFNFGLVPVYVANILNLSKYRMFVQIGRYIFTVIVMTLCSYFLFSWLEIHSWVKLIIMGFISSIVSVILYLLFDYNRNERRMIKDMVTRKVFARRK